MSRYTMKIESSQQRQLADLCARHLGEEEVLLAATLPILRAVKDAFIRRDWASLEMALHQQSDLDRIVGDIQHRRCSLRAALAHFLGLVEGQVSLTELLKCLPTDINGPLRAQLERVRVQVNEVVVTNHWLAVHVRIHLDAYQRLLRDLTGSAENSGRYGRGGKADVAAYRPLIEING